MHPIHRAIRTALAGVLLAASCMAAGAEQEPVRIAYVDWSSSVASANVVCAVLRQRLGRDCHLQQVTADRMWEAVAEGQADAMLSAWLPDTHAHYLAQYGERMVDLGPNLQGTRIGLVVPAVSVGRQTGARGRQTRPYVKARSIEDLARFRDRFGGRIIGIDPEAGVMRATRKALEAYGLDGYRVVEGSEAGMTEALSEAIRRQEWIVVTGWVPHWMFGRWSLRFLDDPKGVYGGEGAIHTFVRQGLDSDMPEVQAFLDRFSWSPEDMGRLMVWIEQGGGLDPYGQAARWVRTQPKVVDRWLQ
jgi:glycine betaine/proline transport system substrate-binding protein